MKILKQDKKENRITLEIEAEADSFARARDEVVAAMAKDMNIAGFRPGKAPKNIVEKNLNPSAVNDHASQHLISGLYPDIIKETGIDPVDYPSVEVLKFEEGKPFVFKLEVEVYPEVKLGKYKGIKLTKKPSAVNDDEVMAVLGNLQNRFSKHVDIEGEAANKDDEATLELEAEADGANIKRWPRQIDKYPIGMGYISKEFDSELQGMKPGDEKAFTLPFPADYHVKEIAGKPVSFKVKLNKLSRRELSPLDDEFAKTVSQFGALAELKEEIRKNLESEKKEGSEADLKNQMVDAASKGAEVTLPEGLVRIETDMMLDELKGSLSRSNLTLENYLKSMKKSEEEIRADLKPPATSRAKGKVVLKKIAEIENITVQPHDIDTEIALMAGDSSKSVDEMKTSIGEGGLSFIKDYLLRRKALDFLVSQAKIEEAKL